MIGKETMSMKKQLIPAINTSQKKNKDNNMVLIKAATKHLTLDNN